MGLPLRHKLSGQAAAKAEHWRFCARCSARLEDGAAWEAEGVMEKADIPEQEPCGAVIGAAGSQEACLPPQNKGHRLLRRSACG